MLDFDNVVVENHKKIMMSKMLSARTKGLAEVFYEFETVIRKDGIPIAKLKTDRDCTQILPVGEKEKK